MKPSANLENPEVINSDQGSQFTCPGWIDTLRHLDIGISMDGRGRAKDNIWIEKILENDQAGIHLRTNPADDGLELYQGINSYIQYYNNRRGSSRE